MHNEADSLTRPGRLAPFAVAATLAWITVLVGASIDWRQYALSSVLLVIAGALTVPKIAGHRNRWLGVAPASLVFLAAVGLLRHSAGGISSGVAALSLIPVFYTALYGRSRRVLFLVLAGMAIFYLAPIVIVGSPSYPATQYRAALLMVSVSSIIGLATQRLVADVRHQAGEASSRERMLRQVSEAVNSLYGSPRPRIDVCEAARSISSASVAVLWEPVPESGALRTTAMAGLDTSHVEVAADCQSAIHNAFRSGRPMLTTQNADAWAGLPQLPAAAGRPTSALHQPLLRGTVPVGVLVVGWPDAVRANGPRATVVELLAHEAVAVIDRADAIDHLTDMAQTDSLTGLPNRRAWDALVKRAFADERSLTIAMLDLDRFKRFNDTYGHPAGDRLLKETAAAWREQLRAGDHLARLGGEEFGLLLLDCSAQTAADVVERLRCHVSQGGTCSAGIAVRQPGESTEALIARADHALYSAKSAGRDRAHMSTPDQEQSSSGDPVARGSAT